MRPYDIAADLRRELIDLLGGLVRDRIVILTASVSRNDDLRRFFSDAGASNVVCIDLGERGTQPLHSHLASMERRIADPGARVARDIEALDPDGRAVVYAGSFTAQETFCGRQVLGIRSADQFGAERKDAQAEFLDRRVTERRHTVDLTDKRESVNVIMKQAMAGLVIVSGIPDGELAIGGSHIYLVDRAAAERGAVAGIVRCLATDCSRALLAPFDPGLPCTYYGFVAEQWVVEFGPFEALVSWEPTSCRLHAVGIARPLHMDYGTTRRAARRVRAVAGRVSRRRRYAGAFCTDGTLRSDGYVVQEVNPRICAGFTQLNRLCEGLIPLALVDLALRARPKAAERRLRTPLFRLAKLLRKQHPVVAFWDAESSAMQAALTASAPCRHFDGWLDQIRQAGAGTRVPLSYLGSQTMP